MLMDDGEESEKGTVTSGSYAMACNVEQPHSPPAVTRTYG